MIKTLLGIRFQAIFAGMTARGSKRKKRSPGMMILFALLAVYLLAVICGMMCFLFYSLAQPYHALGLDWLYFAMAGLMALALSLIGSVFTTQNQLYEAKDNVQLLSMPIPPRLILLSRMIPLLSLNLLYAGLVMIPAMVIYAIFVAFSVVNLILQILSLLAVCLLAQALACLLGWLLHLLLKKLNKAFGSMLFMIVFLCVYFVIYAQAEQLLQAMATNGNAIAGALETWAWPLYALGQGCLGSPLLLVFVAIVAAAFGIVYRILSVTFLSAAVSSSRGRRRRLSMDSRVRSPIRAVTGKELGKFLSCPVYLTNMGLGVVLTAAFPVLGLVFRGKLMETLTTLEAVLPQITGMVPLFICACLSFSVSTACVSTPAVSLEGKNIWILKSMPIETRDILLGKLRFHCLAVTPVSALAGLVLALTFGCGPVDTLLSVLVPALLSLLSGVLGMAAGLKWAKLDFINEAYPCKQSISVLVVMFSIMGLPLVLGIAYYFLFDLLTPSVFLGLTALLLAGLTYGFYRLLMNWGIRKWDSLY